MSSLRERDIIFTMEVFVESSKTVHGAWMPIACTHSGHCLVSMMEQYFKIAQIQGDADEQNKARLLLTGIRIHELLFEQGNWSSRPQAVWFKQHGRWLSVNTYGH